MGTKLIGHKETVLCVAVTADLSGRIVSGGEEGELCVWSLDGTAIHKICVPGGEDITSLFCSRRHSDRLFVASGSKVLTYDQRQFDKPVDTFDYNDDEVNQIVLNEKEDFLAACDDTGLIKVVNLSQKRLHKTLRKHTNICATVAFHPRRSWDLFSGGYDSKFIQWDFSRGRSVCVIDMGEIGLPKSGNEPYLVNPPFVHSVATSRNGHFLACGTERTHVQIFKASKRNPEFLQTLLGHTQGVSQVHFPDFADTQLVTGGNDGRVLFWDLSNLADCNSAAPVNGFAHMNGHGNGAAADPPPANAVTSPRPNHEINHGDKINWLASGDRADQKFLVVADNTEVLTLYPYPTY